MDTRFKKKYIVGSAVIAVAVIVLIFNAMNSCSVKSYTVSEILNRAEDVYGKTVQLEGEVAEGSIVRVPGSLKLEFVLVDENDLDSLPVSFNGREPENFKESRGVSLTGKLEMNGRFIADEILTKCASKYVPEE